MEAFLSWFFEFMTNMLGGIWQVISNIFLGIARIFDLPRYFELFAKHKGDFSVFEWILAVFCFLFVFAIWAALIFMIALIIRKAIRVRRVSAEKEELLEEIADLQQDIVRLSGKELESLNRGRKVTVVKADSSELKPIPTTAKERFSRLLIIDEKYKNYAPPKYNSRLSLGEICEDLRNFAASSAGLYYDIKTVRLMVASLAASKLILLQGISGTGKTSLPYVLGEYLDVSATITSVQPSWRERTELFGYFNEFTQKYKETDFLERVYESTYNDDVNLIVLDEMNISRVEYYFAEMLSLLELPDPKRWKVEIASSAADDPAHIVNGKLSIPENLWYVGTANNDDTTFAISDKVYDRAMIIDLNEKCAPFDAPKTEPKRISASYFTELFDKALEKYPVSTDILDKLSRLDAYVIERFGVSFGNRIMKQIKSFLPVYVASGGSEIEAIDHMLTTKVFRKLELMGLSLVREDIDELVDYMDGIFGKGEMVSSTAYLNKISTMY